MTAIRHPRATGGRFARLPGSWSVALALFLACAASAARAAEAETGPVPAEPGPASGVDPLKAVRSLLEQAHYAEAEREARALLSGLEAAGKPETPDLADVLDALVSALIRDGKSRQGESRQLAERALRIKETGLPPGHPRLAPSLKNLGDLFYETGDYAASKGYFERALAVTETEHGADHPSVARALNDLAKPLLQAGDYAAARALFERSVDILERRLGRDHPDLARPLHNLGILCVRTADYGAARDFLERALAIREAHLDPHHPDLAKTLNVYAVTLRHLGDHAAARGLLERALRIQETTLGPDHPEVGMILDNLGTVRFELGDYEGALDFYRRGLAVRERALGKDHVEVSRSLNNLASLLAPMGETAEARRLLERALAIKEKILGPDHPEVGSTLNNLADLLATIGDEPAARRLYERDLAISEKALGPWAARLADPLIDLGLLSFRAGNHVDARRSYERALAIREKALGPDDRYVAFALNHLAAVHLAAGDRDRARDASERALVILEKKFGPEHHQVAEPLESLARLRLDARDHAAARPLLERALAIHRAAVGPSHPQLAPTLIALAEADLLEGHPDAGLARALAAEEIARRAFQQTARSLPEREALRYEEVRESGLDVALTAVARGGRGSVRGPAVRDAWNQVVQSRALILDEMASRHRRVSGAAGREHDRLRAAVEQARNRLARLIVTGPGDRDSDGYLERVRQAQAAKEDAERALGEASAEFRRQDGRSDVGLDDVARALPSGSALIAFTLYRRRPINGVALAGGSAAPGPSPTYLAFVLQSGASDPVVVTVGPAREIDSLVREWREQAARPPRPLAAARRKDESNYLAAGARLRAAVWDPLVTHLGSARRVFVVPDGALHLVNFYTLPAGTDRYLVETGPLIHVLSAERDLAVPVPPGAPGAGLLVMGDPDYEASPLALPAAGATRIAAADPGASRETAAARAEPAEQPEVAPVYRGPRSACPDFQTLRFRALPRSRVEADRVASGFAEEDPLLKLTGAAASESAFKQMAAGRRVIHLATHAFLLQDGCSWSAGRGEGPPPRGGSASPDPPRAAGDNPLLLTGMALAGANRREETDGREDVEDGILTAEEIASLDLSGVEWAVLSACETGVGAVRSGEGVLGLRRAFQVAGVRTLIMSLWPVEDAMALAWMTRLYEARGNGLDSAGAVREAGRAMIETRRREGGGTHPFYWGAFVAAGDWR